MNKSPRLEAGGVFRLYPCWAHDPEGAQLLVIEALRDRAQRDDLAGWSGAVTVVHDEWLRPLWQALRDRRLDALDVHDGDGSAFRVTARDARRWWVRRRSLAGWT
mgnify:CR=1 FL=1